MEGKSYEKENTIVSFYFESEKKKTRYVVVVVDRAYVAARVRSPEWTMTFDSNVLSRNTRRPHLSLRYTIRQRYVTIVDR